MGGGGAPRGPELEHAPRVEQVESLRAFSDATGEPSPWITRVWSGTARIAAPRAHAHDLMSGDASRTKWQIASASGV